MSKRKGLSLDEKRTRLLQLFNEKQEFFTLKELEKIAPKEKNIVVQSVKDILQELVDDGLVQSEIIGTSRLYWRFVRSNITESEKLVADANKKLVQAEFKLQNLHMEINKEKAQKNLIDERINLLQEVKQLRQQEEELRKQVAKFNEVNPEVVTEMTKKAKIYKDAANVWTDNIFAIQSWCKNKFDISEDKLNKQFDIPEDLDYIE